MAWNHSDTNNCTHGSDEEGENASMDLLSHLQDHDINFKPCACIQLNKMEWLNEKKTALHLLEGVQFGWDEMDLPYSLDVNPCTLRHVPSMIQLIVFSMHPPLQSILWSMLISSNIPSPRDFKLPHPTLGDSNQLLSCGKTGHYANPTMSWLEKKLHLLKRHPRLTRYLNCFCYITFSQLIF